MSSKKKMTALGVVIKWALIIAASQALFILGKEAALRERGYQAIGGEYALLLLPLLYYAVEQTVKDWGKTLRALQREERENEI